MKVREVNRKYLNNIEDRSSGCNDPIKILMGEKASAGRQEYAKGGAVEGMMHRTRRMKPVDTNPEEIKLALMSTKPNSKMSKEAMSRVDMRTGPAYKKGGSVKTSNPMESAMNAERGMAKKMGLKAGGRTKKAIGGVGKIRHEQYD